MCAAAVRKRESLYAELDLADASDNFQLLNAMAEHPILMQRPFVVTPKGTRLARPVDSVREILSAAATSLVLRSWRVRRACLVDGRLWAEKP